MSKDSETRQGGLLSKMVKFVTSPTTHWSDLDKPELSGGDTESRIALKEMIVRKQRNDFVRNREFDMLRKLRRKETLRTRTGGPASPPSIPAASRPTPASAPAR